jgi:hypothetical protein
MRVWLTLALCFWVSAAFAQGFGGIGRPGFSASNAVSGALPPPVVPPVSLMPPQVIGLDYPNNGVSTALTGTTLTLTTDNGQWANTPTSYTYKWHTVAGASLGTTQSITLSTANVGQAIEVDVKAINAAGSATQTSHWFGPIESAVPVAPVAYEDPTVDFGGGVGVPPSTIPLPISPANFLQNGHAIYPGCSIPPAAPNTAAGHVWYFDPIGGKTQTGGGTGADLAHAFKDISALFNTVTGYPSGGLFGFGKTIPPGDTIYIEPGNAANPLGPLNATSNFVYSTSDGTGSGSTVWTWIMPDPAATSPVILQSIDFNKGSIGFILKGFNIETFNTGNMIEFDGGATTFPWPTRDIILENMNISTWLGHSTDPWLPSNYPTTGGTSDGTIVSASPMTSPEDPPVNNVTASAGSNTLTLVSGSAPPVGDYVWSPGYFRSWSSNSNWPSPSSTGIPNGSKVVSVVGSTITIAPCDPGADAATGCVLGPGYSFVPACDPKNNPTSGGCIGTPTAWAGTTRAISNEKVSYTDHMLVLPAGAWNSTDWGLSTASSITITGQAVSGSQDSANPNLYKGVTCVSVKDNTVRNTDNGIAFSKLTNSIAYNNRVKWHSADAYDMYSVHRVWLVHNWDSENTQVWNHQDGIQLGSAQGTSTTTFHPINYNNSVIESEIIQQTDQTNAFARFEQGINTTDNIWWGLYYGTNVVHVTSAGGIGAAGKYNVIVNNSQMGAGILTENQKKTSDKTAIYGVLANNIGNGVARAAANTVNSFCDLPPGGDMTTIAGNLSLPFPYAPFGSGANSSTYCIVGATGVGASDTNPGDPSNSNVGGHRGQAAWTQTDYRSNISGVSPLFTAFDPQASAYWTPSGHADTNPCVRGTFFTTGNCAPGDPGIFDLVPNVNFTASPGPILGNYRWIMNLPQTGSINDAFVAYNAVSCSGQATTCGPNGTNWPAGTYVRATSSGDYNQWQVVPGSFPNPIVPPYSPGIVGNGAALSSLTVAGGGASLGPQTPIADHDGHPWAGPPSIGAYEVVVAAPPSLCPNSGLQFNAACNSIYFQMRRE